LLRRRSELRRAGPEASVRPDRQVGGRSGVSSLAERSLVRWIGPRPGEAAGLVAKGLDGAVAALVDPGPSSSSARAPTATRGSRSRPTQPGVMTTARGSTAWFAPRGRSSSG
jgi:hypothetical protein